MHLILSKLTSFSKTHRRLFVVVMVFLICLVSLAVVKPVYALADSWNWFNINIIGPILLAVIRLLGKLLIAMIQIMIGVAQYSGFIHATAVVKGWVILRDLCNMFFIVILLVIAFSTVLGIEKYSYKKLLPTLLLMAILINFSKMIAGIFIDLAQVVMMTFVNGFKYAAAGNLTTAFGLDEMLKFREEQGPGAGVDLIEVMISLMLGVVMLLIALAVTTVIVLVFMARIVALWILVVLSPIAYFAAAVPGGQKYSSMWWSKFSNYVITGPVLAFFLWLSLAIMAANPGNVGAGENIMEASKVAELQQGIGAGSAAAGAAVGNTINVAASGVAKSDKILSFMISIAMLIGALAATQQLGVAGAKLAGSVRGKIPGVGKAVLKWGATRPYKWATATAGYAGRPALSTLANKTSNIRVLGGLTKFATNWAKDYHKGTVEKKQKRRLKVLEKLGMGEATLAQIAGIEELYKGKGGFWGKALGALGGFTLGKTVGGAKRGVQDVLNARADIKAWEIPQGVRGLKSDQLYGATGLSKRSYHRYNEMTVAAMRNLETEALADPLLMDGLNKSVAAYIKHQRREGERINTSVNSYYSRNSGIIDPLIGDPSTRVGFMAALDKNKQQRTREALDKNPDFFTSEEYFQDQGQYYSEEQYNENRKYQQAKARWEGRGGDVNEMVGINSTYRKAERSEAALLALNFQHELLKNLNLGNAAGAHLTGKEKDIAAEKIGDYYLEQLLAKNEKLPEDKRHSDGAILDEVDRLMATIRQVDTLNLYNKGEGIDPRHVITHENIHSQIDKVDDKELERTWKTMSASEQESEEKRVRSEWHNGEQMSKQEVIKEYFVEGLTNETRYAKKGGIVLKEGMRGELEEQGVSIDRFTRREIKGGEAVDKERGDEARVFDIAEVKPEEEIGLGPDAKLIRAELDTQALAKSIEEGVKEGFKSMEQITGPLERMRVNSDRMLREELYNRRSLKVLEDLRNRISTLKASADQVESPDSIEGKALIEELEELFDNLKA